MYDDKLNIKTNCSISDYGNQTIEYLKLHHVQIYEFDEETGEFNSSGYFYDNIKIDYGPDADEALDPLEY